MEINQIREGILDILTSKESMSLQLNATKISDETSLIDDVALDSIQLLELIVEIEKKFKFSVDVDEIGINLFDQFKDLLEYVHECIQNAKN